MATPASVNATLLNGTCRCCLSEGRFKSMQCGNTDEASTESYTEMLLVTFAISLSRVREDCDLLICAPCEAQLRKASAFRRQVLETEKIFVEKAKCNSFEVEIHLKVDKCDVNRFENGMFDEISSWDSDSEVLSTLAQVKMKRNSSKTKSHRHKNVLKTGGNYTSNKKTLKTNDTEGHYKCLSCSEQFLKNNLLNAHYRNVHVPLTCSLCAKAFEENIPAYSRHMRTKHGLRTRNKKIAAIKCELCALSFTNCNVMSKHVKSIHHRCRMCSKVLRNAYERDEHKRTHSARCTLCNTEFTTEPRLKVHMLQEHHTSKFFKCGTCKGIFRSTPELQRHKVASHGAPVFDCGACDKFFYEKVRLIRHQRLSHMMERDFPCTECEYKAFDSGMLKRHMVKHSDVKPYECEYCKKRFPREGTLWSHERIHTGDKRQVCRLCGAAFVQRASLKYHLEKQHPGQ